KVGLWLRACVNACVGDAAKLKFKKMSETRNSSMLLQLCDSSPRACNQSLCEIIFRVHRLVDRCCKSGSMRTQKRLNAQIRFIFCPTVVIEVQCTSIRDCTYATSPL